MADGVEAGHTIADRYRLIDEVGRGGVGTVWRAHDAQTGKELAIKVVEPTDHQGQQSSTKVGRFLREARAMQRLRSPHVVQVFDHGSCTGPDGENELVYLTMELMVGESLRDRLKRTTKLSREDTMRVLAHVGRAVGLAHQRGIVHRDLKPANIFLCERNDGNFRCKVLDFGMAKSLAMPLATVDPVYTEHGRPLGTPYYMSPEQARGLTHVDHRSDLWAMGVLTYECLLGERPFQGNSLARVFAAIAASPVPVPSQKGEVPPGFDAWFAKAVERDIQKRFQSAKLMVEELQEVLVDATTLSQTHAGVLTSTLNDVLQATLDRPIVSDRTLRRDLPAALGTSFVGRADLLRAMDQALSAHCRVLTLVGASGNGRGRLAHQYARSRAGSFPGGVWQVSLAHCEDADSLWRTVALSIGAQLGESAPAVRIGRALAAMGQLVLVIEQAQGVADHLARGISLWLRGAPSAVFIVTGKKALQVPTERVMEVPALSYPPYGEPLTFQKIKAIDGGELFLKRILGMDRNFVSDPSNAEPAGAIVRMVGGSPLAVELCASRLELRPAQEVAKRLSSALVQPGGTAIMMPDAVVERSVTWVLAQHEPSERAALSQLTVFRGGFTLPAAEAIVDLGRFADAMPVADLVDRFAKRGMLRVSGSASEARYDMHPMVERVCARWQEDAGAGPESSEVSSSVEQRHGRFFAELGSEEALAALHQRGGFVRRARYFAEVANAAAAAARAAERRDGEVAGACSLVVAAVESMMGRHGAASSALVRPVSVSETPEPLRLRCMLAQGRALMLAGRFETAQATLERARTAATPLEDATMLAAITRTIGELYLAGGHVQHAHLDIQLARQHSARSGDRVGGAQAASALAEVQRLGGNLSGAVRLLQEARLAYQELGARQLYAAAIEQLATIHVEQGRHDSAHGAFEAALSLYRELGDRLSEARVLTELGEHALASGYTVEAAALLEQASGRGGELGALELEGRALAGLGTSIVTTDGEKAWRLWAQGEHLLKQAGDDPGKIELAGLWCRRASFELARGAVEAAHRTLHQIEATVVALHGPLPSRLGRDVAALRMALGASMPTSHM